MRQEPAAAATGFLGKLSEMLFEPTPIESLEPRKPENTNQVPKVRQKSADIDDAMVKHITALVMEGKTAYAALREAILPLESYIPDEANRYRAAFALVSKTCSLEQILHSLDTHHLNALDSEILRFKDQNSNQDKLKIDTLSNQVLDLRQKLHLNTTRIDEVRKHADLRVKELMLQSKDIEEQLFNVESETKEHQSLQNEAQRKFELAASVVKERLITARGNILRFLTNNS